MRLAGKVALVTGGARGIGKAICLLFAKEGANVAACDVLDEDLAQLEKEAAGLAGVVKGFHMDVTNREEVKAVVEKTVAEFGKLDTLINNAGITQDAFLHKMTEDKWDKVINVNLKGTFNVTQAAIPYLKEAGSGSITTTSSIVGQFGNVGQTNYAATKAALNNLMVNLASDLGPRGIRVNAVAPGPIWTPLIPSTFDEDKVDGFGSDTPLGRPGQPVEVAPAFVFLASDEASYVSGTVLGVTGGRAVF